MIYLDFAATTPISENALNTYVEMSRKYYGNSQSIHNFGLDANNIVELSKKQLAKILNCSSNGIYFTSSGSEANYLSIMSILKGNKKKGSHIITSLVEHSSILNLFKKLEEDGFEVTYLKTDIHGRISLNELQDSIRTDTVLTSINFVNSEIGTIQEIKKIGMLLRESNVIFHTDAVQAFGKLKIDVDELCIDSISFSGHKIYGPKGVGFCYINPSISWSPLISGTTHQSGFRPGTLDLPSISALVTAATDIYSDLSNTIYYYSKLNSHFRNLILNNQLPVTIYGINQIPNIIGFSVDGIEGQYLMLECDKKGIAISTGSACKVGLQKPSNTMLAIGLNRDAARQFVRISFGKFTNFKHLNQLIEIIKELRENS
ncbi:MAG: cysteine desulfurase [Bacillales bacterium]|nr:cysteine desulfurase [Bacillales bacterium]